MKRSVTAIALFAFLAVVSKGISAKNSEDGLWKSVSERSLLNEPKVRRSAQPEAALYYALDLALLKSKLVGAPIREQLTGQSNLIISFPNAYGQFEQYRVMESSCMEPGLEAKFPMIKTYAAQGIDDPSSFMRFSVTQFGLHTIAFSGKHSTNYIDPYTSDIATYIVYDRHSLGAKPQDFECLTDQGISLPSLNENGKGMSPDQIFQTNDQKLRTFRLAQSCTGEYGAIFMGTGTIAQQKSNVQAQMTITINRVNGVYERDLAVHMNFVANNDLIIYLDATTDPWTNEWNTKTAQTIDAVIGVSNYDIGHNFNTTGGGNAGCIACVCLSTSQTSTHKGRGYTGSSNPTGDAFDIDYVAHEMGHQYGGYHTMNTCSRSGSGQSEVEPASGSTVMGYAGICPSNIQAHSDDDFQYVNVRDISINLQSGNSTCGVVTTLSNQPPTANAGADYTIPKSTAYILEGIAGDPDGNASLTYSWGENDPAQSPGNAAPVSTYTVGPMYRNIPLTTSPNRYMPNIASVIAGNLTPTWEVTPSVARVMNFSFLVRDNSPMGGQTASDLMKVTVAASGPFVITSQSAATTWAGNSTQTITWNVASTTAAPVSCANVNVYLSIDGGYTYPYTLATNLPNNGTANITVPNISTTTARFMVRGAGNIFYDINNANITINSAGAVAPMANITAAAIACQGATINLTDASTGAPTSWAWSTNAGAGATFSNASIQNPTLTFSVAGTYTLSLTATNANGSSTYNKVISINSKPVLTSSTSNALCSGAIANFNLVADVPSTFSWIAASNANVTGESTSVVNSATINNLLSTALTSIQTVAYTVTPTAITGGCVGAPVTVNVNVVPPPTMTSAATSSLCSGSTAAFALSASIPSSFSWIAASNANVTGESTTAQTASTINNTLTLSTGTAQTVVYTVTPTSTSGSCPGTAQTLSITVNPLPVVTASSNPTTAVCPGTSVTLTGGGASVYTWTGGITNAVAFSAAATQTYTVTGTAANGCSGTATKTITVNTLPAVTANPTPASGAVCSGASVTLTGGGATSYTWTGGVTNASSFVPAGTQTYTVTGTDANGCTNTAVQTITVNPLPSVTSASTKTICSGTAVALALTASPASTFSWVAASNPNVSGESTTSQSTNTISNTLSTTQTSAQTVTYSVTPTSSGCIGATQIVTITVNSNPVVTAATNSASGTVCSGTSVTLTGGGASSYSWTGSVTDGAAFTPAGTATYTVTGTDANGCSNTATAMITVNNLPTVTANSNSALCAGNSITLNGGGALSYNWTGGITDGVSFTPAGTASYTVTGTDVNGCSNTAITTVTVNSLPTVTANANSAICMGDAITLNGGGASTYSWTGGVSDGVSFIPAGTASYTVTGTDVNACSNTAVTTVTVNNLPVVTAPANSNICAGDAITLNGGGASTYSWTGGVSDGVSFTPAGTASYTVSGTDVNGCSNTASTTVTVNPLPATPTITQSVADLTSSAASGNQWYFNGALMPGETNQMITPTQNGNYTVVVTDANGCFASSAAYNMTTVGIKEQSNSGFAVTVIPNPNNGTFTLVINNIHASTFTIAVKNVLGQVISVEQVSGTNISKAMDLSGYDAGVYFIHLSANNKQFVTRVIVE
ncbi:MAG: PKD-like domain-containing protein [Bacteroidia bacterium]